MLRIVKHAFADKDQITFNMEDYSKFKYGCQQTSVKFGIELGMQIAQWVREEVAVGDIVMISGAPYNNIPVASTALAKYVVMYLQSEFKDRTFELFKVNRRVSYHNDYGAMTAQEREELIGKETFTCDAELNGTHVIFIDDIVITGAHERNMVRMVDDNELNLTCKSINYAYYAMLTNPDCCPTIESDLNFALIKPDLDSLLEFFAEVSWYTTGILVNTRLTKLILSLPKTDLEELIKAIDHSTILDIYSGTLANDYDTIPQYVDNFKLLKQQIQLWI